MLCNVLRRISPRKIVIRAYLHALDIGVVQEKLLQGNRRSCWTLYTWQLVGLRSVDAADSQSIYVLPIQPILFLYGGVAHGVDDAFVYGDSIAFSIGQYAAAEALLAALHIPFVVLPPCAALGGEPGDAVLIPRHEHDIMVRNILVE